MVDVSKLTKLWFLLFHFVEVEHVEYFLNQSKASKD